MTIISISRDSCSQGGAVAKEAAKRLGLTCLGREALLQAADECGVDQEAMRKAVTDAPSFLERLFHNKKRHVALFKAALLRRVAKGGVVYHGLAGHVFLAGLSQALKVRIVADFDQRVREEMRRDNLTETEARAHLARLDRERCEWTRRLYSVDNRDASLYDLCINLSSTSFEDAVEQIVAMAQKDRFAMTAQARKTLEDMVLTAEAEARLLPDFPSAQAFSRNGEVYVTVNGPLEQEPVLARKVRKLLHGASGVKAAHVGVNPGLDA